MRRVGGRLLGDHAVFGDERAVNAAREVFEVGERASLAGSESVLYRQALGDVPGDRLALAMAAGGELSSRGIDLPAPLDAAEVLVGMGQGNAVALRATQTGLAFDGFSYSDGAILLLAGEDNPLRDIGMASEGAWLAAVVPNLSGAVEALDLELRQVDRIGSAPLPRLPLPGALKGTDQTLLWVAGGDLRSLSGGFDATTDGAESSAALVRALDDLPGLEGRYGFRRDGLSAVFGPSGEAGGLGADERFRQARAWLRGLTPIGYIDLERSRSLLALLAAGAGIDLPEWMESVDRVAVGLNPSASPTAWRLAVSLVER
jgi:hypothetical protein